MNLLAAYEVALDVYDRRVRRSERGRAGRT
ncbi:hypothetical protein [Streptomyces sp. NWU339]|nr:hypothetical protein [Streptomyces sp. NWU339]